MLVRLPLRRSLDPSLEPQGRKFMGNGHGASHRARLPKPPRTPPRGGPPRAASPTEGSRHERRPRALRISDVDDDHMIRSRPCAPTRAAPAASNWARRVSPQVSAPEQDRSRHPEENPPRSAAWGETGSPHRALPRCGRRAAKTSHRAASLASCRTAHYRAAAPTVALRNSHRATSPGAHRRAGRATSPSARTRGAPPQDRGALPA